VATEEERALLQQWFRRVRFPPHARQRIAEEFSAHADEIVERLRARVRQLDRHTPVLLVDQGRSGQFTRAMVLPLLRHWGYQVGFDYNGLKILALRSRYRPKTIRFAGRTDIEKKHEFLADRALVDPLWRRAISLMRRGALQPFVVDTFRGRGVTLETVKGTLARLLGVDPQTIPHFLIAESKNDPLWDAARIIDHYSKREFSRSDRWYRLNYVESGELWNGVHVTYERAHVNRLYSQGLEKHVANENTHDSH